jgi:hypothetical protein
MTIPLPIIIPLPNTGTKLFERKMYRLVDDYRIVVSGREYIIKAGFEYDGASVPTPVKWLLSEAAIMSIAALLHDHLYYTALVSKEEADAIFHEVLKDIDQVRAFDCQVMWYALILFGQAAWDEHRRAGHGK